ncbi:MAG: hypothetical protein WBV23_13315 [Desulfobaccales bacterium]
MSNEAPKPRQLAIFYKKNEYYRLLPATGAFGGPSPTGDIIVDFFVERQTHPEKIILELDPSGPKEIKREGERIVREIQVGILLRPDRAHAIGKWLIEKASQAGFSEMEIKH